MTTVDTCAFMAEASRQIDSVWYGAHSGKWYHMFSLQCSAGEPRFENECCIHLSFGQFHLDPSLQWTIMAFFAPIQFYQSLGRRLFKTFKVFESATNYLWKWQNWHSKSSKWPNIQNTNVPFPLFSHCNADPLIIIMRSCCEHLLIIFWDQ